MRHVRVQVLAGIEPGSPVPRHRESSKAGTPIRGRTSAGVGLALPIWLRRHRQARASLGRCHRPGTRTMMRS